MKDKVVSATWYQPKEAKAYTIPRYVSGDKVDSYSVAYTRPDEGEPVGMVDCMKGVALTGAVSLVAASLTVVTIALF